MKIATACVIVIATTSLSISVVQAAAPTPAMTSTSANQDVATLLFGNPQWSKAPPGSKITYSYSKKTSVPALAPSFDDKIIEMLEKSGSGADDRRSVDVQLFSGANRKPAGPFDAEAQNPILLLVLEENVQELSKAFKGNPRYLKNAIRKAWRDDAKIENASIDVDGKQVAGTRITVTPFVNDAESGQMMGLDGMAYTVEIADSVPGQIANIIIRAPAQGDGKFSETLHYMSEKTP